MVARIVWSDEDMLKMIDLHEREGLTASQIAERFGTSRSAAMGVLHRIKTDLAESEAAGFRAGEGPAQRPENRDGGMPTRWWAERRGVAA